MRGTGDINLGEIPAIAALLVAGLTVVQKELRRKGEALDVSKAPFLVRLRWALSLYASLRGVGWSHEPTSRLPSAPRRRNSSFAKRSCWIKRTLPSNVVHSYDAPVSACITRCLRRNSAFMGLSMGSTRCPVLWGLD